MTVPGGVPAAAVLMCVKARARAKAHALLKTPELPPTRRGALARRAGEVDTSTGRVLSEHASCLLLMQGGTGASTRPGFNPGRARAFEDRKSTRLNSSHMSISYAVFCLKKKKTNNILARV